MNARVENVARGRRLWTIQDLAREFGVAWNTAKARILDSGVEPAEVRPKGPVYFLKDVAMPLLGYHGKPSDDASGRDPDNMPPVDRLAEYRGDAVKIANEQAKGSLIRKEEVEHEMGVMVNAMVQTLDSMGDVLERDCGLAPEAVMKVQEVCDRVRQELYEQCSK